MDEDEVEQRIHDLEASVSELERRIESLTLFAALMIGRLAKAAGNPPDLGLPDDGPYAGEHDAKLAMLLAYNKGAGVR
ncbi:MAG: hypothetical protein KDK12_17955 [Rhodobacteraceae bacterium]|nr:hypothetical protein [Paracoccaceae bacterium]